MLNYSGIQVIGTQRSGTNLLRLILNQLDEISAPHPPHILKTFLPIIGNYGDLSLEANFKRLIADVCLWVESNPVPWLIDLSVEEVFNRSRTRTIYEIFKIIYELKQEAEQAKAWCCKSTFNVHYFNEIEQEGIHPLYIHLYRDGRDVALSFQKAIVGPKHVYFIAQEWVADQLAAFQVREKVPSERFLAISYEDLIHEPRKVIKSICNRLGLAYNEDLLHYYDSKESVLTAEAGEMWQNVKKPIINNNSGKYLSQMPTEEIEIFEQVAGEMLKKLGYPVHTKIKANPPYNQVQIAQFKILNDAMIQKVKANARRDELKTQQVRNELILRFFNRVEI